ncbi:MAG TPA: hypothetical protein VLI05_03710 [Candidatus Saccharimonadia bacterium]|nr:hypothetical protein [Candidatus Saccharimonadia bacterium]
MPPESSSPQPPVAAPQPVAPTPPELRGTPLPDPPSKRRGRRWLIIIGAILVLLFVVWPLVGKLVLAIYMKKSPAEQLLYDSLQKAGSQTMVKLAHSEVVYGSKSDQAAGKVYSSIQSVSEFNATSKAYSTVYMTSDDIAYGVGRCVKGQPYRLGERLLIDNEAQAQQQLQATPTPVPADQVFMSCSYDEYHRYGRLSDGIIPIGYDASQAKSWITALANIKLFKVKDEGAATYKGQTGRKISFTLNSVDGHPGSTDLFFYAVRDGVTGQNGGLKMQKYQFDRILDPGPPNGLSGYYIIDEKTKLPIYSEFQTSQLSDEADGDYQPIVTKQHYSYPMSGTITATTQLESL